MRYIPVERCWNINKHNPNGCPFAQFLDYGIGFRCQATGKNTWQHGPKDPKIELSKDGFPTWCPLKENPIDTLMKYHNEEMGDAENRERYAQKEGNYGDTKFFNGVKNAHYFTIENQLKKLRIDEDNNEDTVDRAS